MIISFLKLTDETEALSLVDELSTNKPLYVMSVGTYTLTGTYHKGDDLEAEYCARQETHQATQVLFTDKADVDNYITNIEPAGICQLSGEFEYEVVEIYEVKNAVWKLYKRFISSEGEV